MTTSKLKYLACIFMVLDHLGFFFQDLPYYFLLRGIGRLSAPIFFFCFVEGYNHTHNKNVYKKRLLYSSFIMCYINFIMLFLFKIIQHPLPQAINLLTPNMFFTFYVMFQILDGIDTKNYKKLLFIIFIPFMEYNYFACISILIFKYVKQRKIQLLLFIFLNGILCLLLNNFLQICMIGSVIFLYFYNEERGKYSTTFFYIFYPLHFYLIAIFKLFL